MVKEIEVDADLDVDEGAAFEDEYSEEGTFDIEDFRAMGIDPLKPTSARPGTEEKVLMLSARYAAGVPLWHMEDCYDHGPDESELMGSLTAFQQPSVGPTDLDDEVESDQEVA